MSYTNKFLLLSKDGGALVSLSDYIEALYTRKYKGKDYLYRMSGDVSVIEEHEGYYITGGSFWSCSWVDFLHWVDSDNLRSLLDNVVCIYTWDSEYISLQLGDKVYSRLYKIKKDGGVKELVLLDKGSFNDSLPYAYIEKYFLS